MSKYNPEFEDWLLKNYASASDERAAYRLRGSLNPIEDALYYEIIDNAYTLYTNDTYTGKKFPYWEIF